VAVVTYGFGEQRVVSLGVRVEVRIIAPGAELSEADAIEAAKDVLLNGDGSDFRPGVIVGDFEVIYASAKKERKR
jgi:hypothetical protein